MYGNILQYITAVILLKYENVCDFDIAGPNMQVLKYCPTLRGSVTLSLLEMKSRYKGILIWEQDKEMLYPLEIRLMFQTL